jgi:hypothetical protein
VGRTLAAHRAHKEIFLVAEVAVDRLLRDAGLAGDLIHAGIGEALFGKQLYRRIQYQDTLFFALGSGFAHRTP